MVVFGWFRGGSLISGGEEGFSVFNNRSVFSQTSLWQETGSGYLMPAYATRLMPVLFVFALQSVNLSLAGIQVIFYFTLIYSGLIGFYFLTLEIFKDSKKVKLISFFSTLFYFFNLYSQSQIFGRFIYSAIALWSLAPIFLYCFIMWMETARFRWLIYLTLVSTIYSLAFSQPAHVLALLSPTFLWTFIKVLRSPKKRMYITILFLVGISLWVVFSLWWIYPYFKLGTLAFGQKLSADFNLESLVSVSQYFPTKELILLRQSFLFGPASGTFEFYSSSWVYLVSVIGFIFVLLGITKLRKFANGSFILLTFLVGWFVSKGSNPPLGKAFFEFLFSNFSFTQSLRNSYEKFGLVFLIPYSLLLGIGYSLTLSKFKSSIKIFFFLPFILLFCVFLVLPIWNGDVFTKSLHVDIPSYYEGTNAYLNERQDDGRILHLPMLGGDTVGYSWGYRGVEPAEFLFDRSSVSKILRAKYFDEKYLTLYKDFTNNRDYSEQLEEMNIKYLILHHDLDPEASGATPSAEVAKHLEENSNIRQLKIFGNLTVYEFTANKDTGLFFAKGEIAKEMDYEKLNPTHYKVLIRDSMNPFSLIFKSTFSELWEAKINGEKINDHFLVYDYANGWRINKTGDYTVDVIFKVWPWD